MTLLGKREVRPRSLFAVRVAGLDSGLDNFLQKDILETTEDI